MIRSSAICTTSYRIAGFTLFELVVTLVIMSVLIGVFFDHFLELEEIAEKTAMEQTVLSIRSALKLQMAALITGGRSQEIAQLADGNPMRFVSRTNYAGELSDPDESQPPKGMWYFDPKHNELVYRISGGANFSPSQGGDKRVRYQVKVVRGGASGVTTPPATNEIWGVTLEEVEPYEWLIK